MSVRRPRGHRRVGDDWSSILLQGSQSQLRVGVSDPPMRLRGEANVDGVPPEPTGGSGTCRTGPEHVAPITGYGAKAPVGFPCWMSRSTPALPYREGTADPGRVMTRIASRKAGTGLPHGAAPRAPLPHWRDEATASRTARAGPMERLRLRHILRDDCLRQSLRMRPVAAVKRLQHPPPSS